MVRHAKFGSYHDLSPEGSGIILGIGSFASHGEIVRHERQTAPVTPKNASALAGLRAAMSVMVPPCEGAALPFLRNDSLLIWNDFSDPPGDAKIILENQSNLRLRKQSGRKSIRANLD